MSVLLAEAPEPLDEASELPAELLFEALGAFAEDVSALAVTVISTIIKLVIVDPIEVEAGVLKSHHLKVFGTPAGSNS